jgi:hypothetical protein
MLPSKPLLTGLPIGLTACFLLLLFSAGAQSGRPLQIDNRLRIQFPGAPKVSDTLGSTLYTYDDGSIAYQVARNDAHRVDGSSEKAYREYKDQFVRGFTGSDFARGFRHQVFDTAIGGAPGFLIALYEPSDDVGLEEAYLFSAIRDTSSYTIQALVRESGPEADRRVQEFFRSVTFGGGANSRAETGAGATPGTGISWGAVLLFLVVTGLLALVVRSMISRKYTY